MSWPFSRRRRSRAAGFTLIELLVVLAVIGLIAGLMLHLPRQRSPVLQLRAAAGELAAELRLARAQAIALNQPVALVVDLADGHYGIDGGGQRALPRGTSVELLTIAGERRDARQGDIRFNPDGSSTGGRVSLAGGGRSIAVGVDWLTGRVTIADIR